MWPDPKANVKAGHRGWGLVRTPARARPPRPRQTGGVWALKDEMIFSLGWESRALGEPAQQRTGKTLRLQKQAWESSTSLIDTSG